MIIEARVESNVFPDVFYGTRTFTTLDAFRHARRAYAADGLALRIFYTEGNPVLSDDGGN